MKRLSSISNPLRTSGLRGWEPVAMGVEFWSIDGPGLDNRQVTEIDEADVTLISIQANVDHNFRYISHLLNSTPLLDERSGRYKLNAVPLQD